MTSQFAQRFYIVSASGNGTEIKVSPLEDMTEVLLCKLNAANFWLSGATDSGKKWTNVAHFLITQWLKCFHLQFQSLDIAGGYAPDPRFIVSRSTRSASHHHTPKSLDAPLFNIALRARVSPFFLLKNFFFWSPNILQRMIERKLNFFGHIYRMPDDRLFKQVVFGITDSKNKRRRPKRRWVDELVDWCNKDIGTLHSLAMVRTKWTHFVKYVMDTTGHWAHEARERETN